LWDTSLSAAPEFSGSEFVELPLRYSDIAVRARINLLERTFVFHPRDSEEPLASLSNALLQLSQQRQPDTNRAFSKPRLLGELLLLLGFCAFTIIGIYVLLARTTSGTDRLKVLCATCFFGLGALLSLRDIRKFWKR
jgi:hypothetical protein